MQNYDSWRKHIWEPVYKAWERREPNDDISVEWTRWRDDEPMFHEWLELWLRARYGMCLDDLDVGPDQPCISVDKLCRMVSDMYSKDYLASIINRPLILANILSTTSSRPDDEFHRALNKGK
jgi:hypothetical protein